MQQLIMSIEIYIICSVAHHSNSCSRLCSNTLQTASNLTAKKYSATRCLQHWLKV